MQRWYPMVFSGSSILVGNPPPKKGHGALLGDLAWRYQLRFQLWPVGDLKGRSASGKWLVSLGFTHKSRGDTSKWVIARLTLHLPDRGWLNHGYNILAEHARGVWYTQM